LPSGLNTSISKTLKGIRVSYSFSENDLKHQIPSANNLLRKEPKLPILLEQSFSFVDTVLKKLHWLVTSSCNSSHHQRFMKEKFFKNEISENISQKFYDQ